jgi:prepilin-type N-terminal cleavage/methylation domain-containing protein
MTLRRAMPRSGEDGFTFIEVLQALSLSAIGLLALSSLTMGTISANAKARRITAAATLAQAKMEEIRNLAYTAVADGSDEVTDSTVHYSRSWTVCTDCPIQGTKEVTMTVRWREQADRTVKLQTIVSQ